MLSKRDRAIQMIRSSVHVPAGVMDGSSQLTLWVSSRIPSLANLALALSPLERCSYLAADEVNPFTSPLAVMPMISKDRP